MKKRMLRRNSRIICDRKNFTAKGAEGAKEEFYPNRQDEQDGEMRYPVSSVFNFGSTVL